MSCTDPIDATGYDFDRWMQFAFNHPVSEKSWYLAGEMEFTCSPPAVIGYYARLFRDPVPVLSAYDDDQIEQGLWFVVSYQLGQWLWDDRIPLAVRLDCIEAMPVMFRAFLIDHPGETACFMWWDLLRFFGDSPDRRVEDAMLRALEAILQVPSRHCQMSALHGLGHLEHEGKEPIIRRFLAASPHVDSEMREYAEHAIAGNVL